LEEGKLGKTYEDGEAIIREGEMGDRMFIIQSGHVRVSRRTNGQDMELARLKAGDFFGEMTLIDKEVRSATVSAIGQVRLLSIDKKNFLRRVHEDPSLAYRVIHKMSQKIRELNEELSKLKPQQP